MKKKQLEETFVVEPPPQVFWDEGLRLNAFDAQARRRPLAIRCEYPPEGGMYLYLEGFKYPAKGFPFEKAIWGIDPVKRATLSLLRFLASKPMRYLFLFLFFMPFRTRLFKAFLHEYAEFTNICLQRVYLQPRFCCVMVRELHRAFSLMDLNNDEKLIASALCMFLEWDDAYRYRVQSLFNRIVDKEEFLKHPSEAIRLLVSGAHMTDDPTMKLKWEKVGMFISLALRVKKIKKFFLKFMGLLDFEKLKLDKADLYVAKKLSYIDTHAK